MSPEYLQPGSSKMTDYGSRMGEPLQPGPSNINLFCEINRHQL